MSSIRRGSLLRALLNSAAGAGTAPTPAAPVLYIAPALSGSGQVGSPLTRVPGVFGGYPSPSVSWTWKVAGTVVQTGGNTYVPVSADLGKTVTLTDVALNSQGTATGTTPPSAPVTAAPVGPTAPSFSASPSISGSSTVGSTLTRTAGTVSGNPTPSVAWVWQRDGVTVQTGGATYTTGSTDDGKTITLVETATNSLGSASSASVGVLVINAPTAPVLSNFASDGTFDTTFAADAYVGLTRELQVSDDASFTTLRQDLLKLLAEQDIDGTVNSSSWAATSQQPPRNASTLVIEGLNFGTGTRYIRERLRRDDGVNSAWSNVVSATLANANATTKWRLQPTGAPQSSSWYVIADVITRQTVGDAASAVVASSVTGTPISWNATHVASNVLDGNPATDFYGDVWNNGLVFTFSSPVYIPEIQIRSGASDATSCVSGCKWQRSMDGGSSWIDVITFAGNGAGSWTPSLLRTFN